MCRLTRWLLNAAIVLQLLVWLAGLLLVFWVLSLL